MLLAVSPSALVAATAATSGNRAARRLTGRMFSARVSGGYGISITSCRTAAAATPDALSPKPHTVSTNGPVSSKEQGTCTGRYGRGGLCGPAGGTVCGPCRCSRGPCRRANVARVPVEIPPFPSLLHLDVHLGEIVSKYGMATYGILFAIVFAEDGPGHHPRSSPVTLSCSPLGRWPHSESSTS